MFDPFQIAFVVIAVFSAIFVALREGTKVTLDYRESETTMNRKRRIDTKLQGNARKEIEAFLKDKASRQITEETLDAFGELGYKGYVSRYVTEDILEKITYFIESTLKNITIGIASLFVTAIIGIYIDISLWFTLLVFVLYVIVTVAYFLKGISALRKHYFLRKKLISLDETPTLENAIEIRSDLVDRQLL